MQEDKIDAAVQPAPLNFIAIDAGYSDLGEVTDYISEIAFTTLIVDARRIEGKRKELLVFLKAMRDATAIIYDGSQDKLLISILEELGEAEGPYAQKALDYMRDKRVFPKDLSIPDKAFAKSVELMQKAGLADDRLVANSKQALDTHLLAELEGKSPSLNS